MVLANVDQTLSPHFLQIGKLKKRALFIAGTFYPMEDVTEMFFNEVAGKYTF